MSMSTCAQIHPHTETLMHAYTCMYIHRRTHVHMDLVCAHANAGTHVFTCVPIYICIDTHAHLHKYTSIQTLTYTNTCIHIITHTHAHIHVDTCTQRHINSYMHTNVCVNTETSMHTRAQNTSTHIPIYIHNYIHTCAFTHVIMYTYACMRMRIEAHTPRHVNAPTLTHMHMGAHTTPHRHPCTHTDRGLHKCAHIRIHCHTCTYITPILIDVPMLATSIRHHKFTLTLHLRDGIAWHDRKVVRQPLQALQSIHRRRLCRHRRVGQDRYCCTSFSSSNSFDKEGLGDIEIIQGKSGIGVPSVPSIPPIPPNMGEYRKWRNLIYWRYGFPANSINYFKPF